MRNTKAPVPSLITDGRSANGTESLLPESTRHRIRGSEPFPWIHRRRLGDYGACSVWRCLGLSGCTNPEIPLTDGTHSKAVTSDGKLGELCKRSDTATMPESSFLYPIPFLWGHPPTGRTLSWKQNKDKATVPRAPSQRDFRIGTP